MSEYYEWGTERAKAVRLFGDVEPNGQLETEMLAAFTDRPREFVVAVKDVAEDFRNGKIYSCWPILRSRLEPRAVPSVTATDEREKAEQTRLCEAWIRNAGFHIESEAELVDELFGRRGRLRYWPDLHARMVELWESLSPTEGAV